MNRRQLLALGAGLVVGEPVRRAYSFLNGHGLDRGVSVIGFYGDAAELQAARARMRAYIRDAMLKAIDPVLGTETPSEVQERVERAIAELKLQEQPMVATRSVYHPDCKRIVVTVRMTGFPISMDL